MARSEPSSDASAPAGLPPPDARSLPGSVLDGLGAHVCLLDARGVILTVNRAWREFALANGAPPDTHHEGTSYLSVCEAGEGAGCGVGEQPSFAAGLRDVLAGRVDAFEFEYPCHSATEQRWFMARVSRVRDSDPPLVVVAHDDISALKRAQLTLARREAVLADLAASIPGALFRLAVAPDGALAYRYLSPGAAALFGVAPTRLAADPRSIDRQVLPEDREARERSLRSAAAAGVRWESEHRIQGADGAVRWVQAQALPRPDGAGGTLFTGLFSDVTDRRRAEADLRISEETYRMLFQTIPLGVVYHDRQGRITSANPAAQRILGLSLDQMQGRTAVDPRWRAIREDGADFPGDEHPAMQALRTAQPVRDVVMGVSVPERGYVWISVNAMPVIKDGELVEVYASFEDITQRVLLGQELRLQATTDYLTGLANRRYFMDRLEAEFSRFRRRPTHQTCLLALDLDHFKRVNDTHGHAAGDQVLRHVAELMRQTVRRPDVLSRSGGEEFLLLLPDTGRDAAVALAERIRRRVAGTPTVIDGLSIPVTISIGVSALNPADSNRDAVLARADAALYEAKRAGRDAVRVAA
ncbi:MAG: diguanylate cyclase [Betaproteobacteria bacterium]|nr:diguanylate cyclase [Betaproteobacteria bacterium]